MPIIDKIYGVATSEQSPTIGVPEQLYRELTAAGIVHPGDDGRLSVEQMNALVAGRSTTDRMRLRAWCQWSGILPTEQ